MPNVERYSVKGRTRWKIDVWVQTREGRVRVRERDIPTREQAIARLAKVTSEAYEGRAFDIAQASKLTVQAAWDLYKPISERDNDSWKSDRSRAAHLCRHLGKRVCASLTQEDVDGYRTARSAEKSKRGGPPSASSLNREVETLKRILNYAVACRRLAFNPIAKTKKLDEAPPRSTVLDDSTLERLLQLARSNKRWAHVEAFALVGFDTGMRKTEVLRLRRDQVDWRAGVIRLTEDVTKTEKPRVVALQQRTLDALKAVPAVLGSPFIFTARLRKPGEDRKPVGDYKKAWRSLTAELSRQLREDGLDDQADALEGAWIHDLRHSFCTWARRRGIAESVVMQSSGHKTRAVFDRYNLVDESDAVALARRMEEARAAERAAAEGAGQRAAAQEVGQNSDKAAKKGETP